MIAVMETRRRWEWTATLALALTVAGAGGAWYSLETLRHRVPPPRFSDFPVHTRFDAKSAHPRADAGIATEELPAKPNFAGRYMVIESGCGTECQSFAIVDAESGASSAQPFALRLGAEYRVDSSLLIADPPAAWRRAYGTRLAEAHDGPPESQYFRWTGKQFVPIATVRVTADFP